MAEVLQSPLHVLPRSRSRIPRAMSAPIVGTHLNRCLDRRMAPILSSSSVNEVKETAGDGGEQPQPQLSLVELFLAALRRSVSGCRREKEGDSDMEIGLPTDATHEVHVTFDRFDGFLGLPVEFEVEVPKRPPSASASVFGVSTESMQLTYDFRGNCVPTILLLMQSRLYSQGGLQAEGIFRINAENAEEESVRDEINRGIVPDDVDVHCLASLIKAWFRELPTGLLDSLSAEQVMRVRTEADCASIVRLLPRTEASLLDWAVNMMADVAEFEEENKMNARNVAVVFAPNMTHMADPLTALVHAVQVMNLLKTLVEKILRQRRDCSGRAVVGASDSDGGGRSPTESTRWVVDGGGGEESDGGAVLFVCEDPATEMEDAASVSDSGCDRKELVETVVLIAAATQLEKASRGGGGIILSSVNSREELVEGWR